jgi:putative DNA primase/helicase
MLDEEIDEDKKIFVPRFCFQCGGVIDKKIDNEAHYGTCPHCWRGNHFVTRDEQIDKAEDQEREKIHKNSLLNKYNVINENAISPQKLGELLMHEHRFNFISITDESKNNSEIYYYENGYYHSDGEVRIKEMVNYYLGDKSSIHRRNETVDYIRHSNDKVNRSDIEPNIKYVNFKNGIYDMKEDKLYPHSPDYLFINQIPWDYDKDATCPKIEEFMKQVLYEKDIPIVQEMFGFCFLRQYTLRSAFLMYGGGANGKGILVELLSRMLGRMNYSTRKLHDLTEDKFAKASLYGRLANIGGEISGKGIQDTSDFKLLTGGEPVCGEKKFMGDFTFQNYAKLIFNANSIPRASFDKTDAFFNRWIIIAFPRTFPADDPNTLSRDVLLAKLSTDEEMRGLVIWSLEGLKRLNKKGKFSLPYSEDEKADRYNMLTKNEFTFINEYLCETRDTQDITDTEAVYREYSLWSKERSFPTVSKVRFSRSIKKAFPKAQIEVSRVGDLLKKHYSGVTWLKMPEHGDLVKTITIESFNSNIPGKPIQATPLTPQSPEISVTDETDDSNRSDF